MKKINLLSIMICALMLAFSSCVSDKDENETPTSTYKGKQIISFDITTPAASGVIDTINKTVTITIPQGTAVNNLTPNIVLASGLTISPASGQAQNFSSPVKYTVKLPDNTTSSWTVTVQTVAAVTVNSDVKQSITWSADKLYIIKGDVHISDGAVLTIQPGTIIQFDANASLNIGYSSNATLIANGTATKPIIFTSSALLPAAGAWDGIYFYGNTLSNSVMNHCQVLFGGSSNGKGAINLLACDLAIDNCTVSKSGNLGIYTSYSNSKGGFVSFTNNTISNTTKYAIEINAQKVGLIGAGNTFTDTKGVHILGDMNSTEAQTWKNLGTPYIITNEVDIDGNLTVEAGTTFKFEAGGFFVFGYYSNTIVTMVGTSTNPITFTSNAASPTAGAWRGLIFYSKTQETSNMSYCIIDYAGSNSGDGAVNLEGCSLSYTNNTIRNSNSYGITLSNTAGFKAFNNNSIGAANHLITIYAAHVPDLGTSNTMTAATGKGILISGDARYADAVTWKKQPVDFYINDEVDLDGTITFEAGTTFKFGTNGWLAIGYYQSTTFTAVGSAGNEIRFTSSSASPAAGAWKGIYFYSNTLSNTILNYCILEYCGKSSAASIDTDASMSVSNTQINNSASTNKATYSGSAVVSGTGNNFTWTKI